MGSQMHWKWDEQRNVTDLLQDQLTEPRNRATEQISRYQRRKLISQVQRWSVKKYLVYAHKWLKRKAL